MNFLIFITKITNWTNERLTSGAQGLDPGRTCVAGVVGADEAKAGHTADASDADEERGRGAHCRGWLTTIGSHPRAIQRFRLAARRALAWQACGC